MKTDINMFYTNARAFLPSKLGDEFAAADSAAEEGAAAQPRLWRWSKVHKGFATAYSAIGPQLLRSIQKLHDQNPRPIYLTGHSLGGALATLCSLDLVLRLGINRRNIVVSTFGSPRVGNHSFAKFYNENIPIHWRIVVGPDVVTKLPKFGFTHVGKKVLITSDGDLFIDPNALELSLWSGEVASIMYHRKASYLLAMRAWCERHHGEEYVPEFWSFPVSKDESRLFNHVIPRDSMNSRSARENTMRSSYGPPSSKHHRAARKRKRLREMDAMIEALGALKTQSAGAVDPGVSARWERLVQAAIRANPAGPYDGRAWREVAAAQKVLP
jgi:hypothetical protein